MSRLVRAVPAALISLVLLAACGADDDASSNDSTSPSASSSSSDAPEGADPSALLADAAAAGTNAQSVRLQGSFVDGGVTTGIDLRLVNGRGGTGTITNDGQALEILGVDGAFYIRGSGPAQSLVDGSDGALLWIATDGEPFPLGTEGSAEGDATWSEWNAAVELNAPADALDLSTLG